jgi:hypothetical protein
MSTKDGRVDYDHFLALVQPYSGLQTETSQKKTLKVKHVDLPEQLIHLKEKRDHNVRLYKIINNIFEGT